MNGDSDEETAEILLSETWWMFPERFWSDDEDEREKIRKRLDYAATMLDLIDKNIVKRVIRKNHSYAIPFMYFQEVKECAEISGRKMNTDPFPFEPKDYFPEDLVI